MRVGDLEKISAGCFEGAEIRTFAEDDRISS